MPPDKKPDVNVEMSKIFRERQTLTQWVWSVDVSDLVARHSGTLVALLYGVATTSDANGKGGGEEGGM